MSNNYRKVIIRLLETLNDSYGYLFAELLNLAASGEMKSIMQVFEDGDIYDFRIEHFDDLKDTNIQKLIVLFRLMEKIFQEIKEDNNILSEEINSIEPGFGQ